MVKISLSFLKKQKKKKNDRNTGCQLLEKENFSTFKAISNPCATNLISKKKFTAISSLVASNPNTHRYRDYSNPTKYIEFMASFP